MSTTARIAGHRSGTRRPRGGARSYRPPGGRRECARPLATALAGGDVARTDADRALDALAALRGAYRARAFGATFPELDLTRLEDALDLAARRVSARAGSVAQQYLGVGRLYVAGDPTRGDVVEVAAFDAVAATLIAARKA